MQLPSIEPKFHEVRFTCPSGNSDAIYLSDTPANAELTSARFAIAAGANFPLKITNLSKLYAYGTVADVLDMVCELKTPKEEKNVKTDKGQ